MMDKSYPPMYFGVECDHRYWGLLIEADCFESKIDTYEEVLKAFNTSFDYEGNIMERANVNTDERGKNEYLCMCVEHQGRSVTIEISKLTTEEGGTDLDVDVSVSYYDTFMNIASIRHTNGLTVVQAQEFLRGRNEHENDAFAFGILSEGLSEFFRYLRSTDVLNLPGGKKERLSRPSAKKFN